MENKLSVGDTLGETFAIYRDQAAVLLPVAFWLFLAVAIAELLAGDDELSLFLVSLVLGLAITFLYEGMVVALVKDVRDGRRDHSVGDIMRSVVPVLLPLVGAGVVIAFGAGFAALLLVVPGLYLLTIWAVTAPVIVIERRGVFDALGRSRQLVRGYGWPVFGVIVVAVLIGVVVALLLVASADAITDGEILGAVFSTLAATVTAPIEGLVASVLYFRLLDLQREAPASDSSASAAAEEPPVAS
jgi:hypothetical protein